MIQRAAKIAGFDGSKGSIDDFSDAGSVSDWALDAAQWNAGSGLVIGSNGQLRLQDNITRAETATLVLKLLQKAGLINERTPLSTQKSNLPFSNSRWQQRTLIAAAVLNYIMFLSSCT